MANRTVKDANSVRGTNPQYLVEKIIRSRIYDSRYWKEECFALSAELLVDKAMELKFVGGVFGGNIKPTPFLCLLLKMLQIQPEKDIVVEFIRQDDYKYVRSLGAVYMRLVGTSNDCYKYLEPLLNDYRKLRRQNRQGIFEVIHMDEFIDELLREERVCDVILPRLQKRHVLEENNTLDPRVSALEDDMEEPESEEDEKDIFNQVSDRSYGGYQWRDNESSKVSSPQGLSRRRRSRSPRKRSPTRKHSRERDRHHHRSRSRERERNKPREKERRHRSHSPHEKRGREKKSTHHGKHRHRSRERKEKSRGSNFSSEIAEANAVRAKLGLQPLRP